MDVVHTPALARDTVRTVRQNLLWAALCNTVCVPLALLGHKPPWLAGLGVAGSSLLAILNALRLAETLPVRHADRAGATSVLACPAFAWWVETPMDIFYLPIAISISISIVLVLVAIGLSWWALQAGQFDNIEREDDRAPDPDRFKSR